MGLFSYSAENALYYFVHPWGNTSRKEDYLRLHEKPTSKPFFLQNEASNLTFLHLDFSNYKMDTRHAWKTFFKAFPLKMRRSLTIFYKVAPWMRRYNFQTFRNALEDEPNLNYADTSENEASILPLCSTFVHIPHLFFN